MLFNHFSQTTRNTERENVLSTGRKQYNKLSVFLLHFTTHPHRCRRGCERARRAQCHEGAKKSPLMAGIFLSLGADGLLLTDFYIGDGDGATVVIDAPAVLLDTIDALRVGTYIVDIHGKN